MTQLKYISRNYMRFTYCMFISIFLGEDIFRRETVTNSDYAICMQIFIFLYCFYTIYSINSDLELATTVFCVFAVVCAFVILLVFNYVN